MMEQQQPMGFDPNAMMQRLRRLATLDTTVFDEIRGDPSSTVASLIVAVGAIFLSGIGGWLWWVLNDFGDSGEVFLKSAIIGSLIAAALWAVAIAIAYVILTQVFRARADLQELLRVMGFGAAPLALGVLMFIPILDIGIGLTSLALFFGGSVIAAQSATDAPAGRVLVAVGAGFAIWAIILTLLVSVDLGNGFSGGDYNVFAPGYFLTDVGTDFLKELA